jgi:hypothetical protein
LQKIEISGKAFDALLEEAEIMWGKFKDGEYVPGLFRPTAPAMHRPGSITA